MLRELPPDLAEQLATVSLEFHLSVPIEDDLPGVQNWHVEALAYDPSFDEPRAESVAHINVVKGSLAYVPLWDQLDAIEGDLELIASVVLGREGSDLVDDLEERIEGATGAALLILNSVTLAERWRGYGVGAFLAGMAIEQLSGDAYCAATYPAPLDDSEGAARKRAVRKLERVWGQIGFTPFRGGVWILDTGLVHLSEALERMRVNFGLAGSDARL